MDDHEYESRGFYRPAFFSIYLEGEFREDYENLSNQDLGTFVHEYVHYLQNLTTINGLMSSGLYFTQIHFLKKFIAENTCFEIPLGDDFHSNAILKARDRFQMNYGYKEGLSLKYDRAEYSVEFVPDGQKQHQMVVLHFFSRDKLLKSVEVGNLCIKESMAYLCQSFFDPDAKLLEIPYSTAEILCGIIIPDLMEDKRRLIALCYIALSSENSGYTFYELLISAKERYSELSGKELINVLLKTFSVVYQGKNVTLAEMTIQSLSIFKERLQGMVYSNIEHFEKIIENVIMSYEERKFPLIEVLYEEKLNNAEKVKILLENYGIPHIWTRSGYNFFPKSESDQETPLEFVELIGQRIVLDRLLGINHERLNGCCSLLPMCQKSESYGVDDNCYGTQWKREIPCPFIIVSDHWGLRDKIK
ncbi:hypothetical protein [Algoriphagus aquimarinus]|uniref:hypothetical protein n=1 Tax=Algoriphagus aquimarinus TaxID=237018 RepID=UPI0030DD8358|tara:strand:- start:41152 stop:42405 length:1254 start_codon:yes stop_codon:yes gene_type:complete